MFTRLNHVGHKAIGNQDLVNPLATDKHGFSQNIFKKFGLYLHNKFVTLCFFSKVLLLQVPYYKSNHEFHKLTQI